MAFTCIGKHSELPEKQGYSVRIGTNKIVLFRVGEHCYALEDNCTHRDVPLSLGECTATEVICPVHQARFDLATGQAQTPPASKPVKTYPVQIRDGLVLVDVDSPNVDSPN